MNVSSFQEALQCFELNFQEFREYMWSCHERGIGFICLWKENQLIKMKNYLLSILKDLYYSSNSCRFKKWFYENFISSSITIAVMNPGLGATVLTMRGTSIGAVSLGIGLMGVSLAMAGLQQIMAPDPSVDINRQDESYLFSRFCSTAKEGDPVPVLYGKLRIPGRPISFEIKGENSFY